MRERLPSVPERRGAPASSNGVPLDRGDVVHVRVARRLAADVQLQGAGCAEPVDMSVTIPQARLWLGVAMAATARSVAAFVTLLGH